MRDSNITAKVVADSISESGQRITTFELEYPRFIHGEILTNRLFSRNCSSSRAIPIKKMIEYTENNMAVPLYWGKNRSGMQADGEIRSNKLPVFLWKSAFKVVKCVVKVMGKLGLHKQIPNRLLESWQMIKVVVTATDFDNFFNLRVHQSAQPEIAYLANKMWEAKERSSPKLLKAGQWHLPYVETFEVTDKNTLGANINNQHYLLHDSKGNNLGEVYLEDAIKLSAASCAAQSYRTETMSLKKAEKIFNMLISDDVLHASPFENLATPVQKSEVKATGTVNIPQGVHTWEKGITHMRRDGKLCSGNFTGWIQYRHLLDNNTCEKYNHEERIKSF